MEQTNQDGNSHENALSKLTESAYRFMNIFLHIKKRITLMT